VSKYSQVLWMFGSLFPPPKKQTAGGVDIVTRCRNLLGSLIQLDTQEGVGWLEVVVFQAL